MQGTDVDMFGLLSAALTAKQQEQVSDPPPSSSSSSSAVDNLERLLAAQLMEATGASEGRVSAGPLLGHSAAMDTNNGGNSGVLFKLRHILVGACTWNSEQKLYVFEAVGVKSWCDADV